MTNNIIPYRKDKNPLQTEGIYLSLTNIQTAIKQVFQKGLHKYSGG
jgi:hypothetical protein